MSFAGAPIVTQGLPSISSLLGSSGSQALIDNINESLGARTFFGSVRDSFADLRNTFIDNIITPIKHTTALIQNVVNTVMNPDVIRPIITEDDFKHIPPSMHLPILMYEPVRRLLEQGRITGFGYNPDFLPEEDVFGRLINNGVVEDVIAARDERGMVSFVEIWDSTDPILNEEELTHIEKTRNKILELLETTRIDPTDPTNERG